MDHNVFVKQARLYETLTNKTVRCLTCEHRCTISEGDFGICKTRKNAGGVLYTLVYGNISSLSCNPIEKKPLFHFWPGTFALTVGTWSCNFTCPWCQNSGISKISPNESTGKFLSPEQLIELMIRRLCKGTSYSFNEPTLLLEHAIEVFPIARKYGCYNTYVTNGYMTLKALDLLIDAGLDALNIDIKGCKTNVSRYCGANIELVWRNAAHSIKKGVHVEITTLIIPGVNDDEKCLRFIAARIKEQLTADTPWHVTRYFPAYEFAKQPPSIQKLERAREIGHEEGLKYVYIGNVANHPAESTYCPGCKEILIERNILGVSKYRIDRNGNCPHCGEKIKIIGGSVSKIGDRGHDLSS
ncbi:MAG: AmmeMemoRadiSam system radical SAM enzyme [Candidatus Hodarchaeota archaeon]